MDNSSKTKKEALKKQLNITLNIIKLENETINNFLIFYNKVFSLACENILNYYKELKISKSNKRFIDEWKDEFEKINIKYNKDIKEHFKVLQNKINNDINDT